MFRLFNRLRLRPFARRLLSRPHQPLKLPVVPYVRLGSTRPRSVGSPVTVVSRQGTATAVATAAVPHPMSRAVAVLAWKIWGRDPMASDLCDIV